MPVFDENLTDAIRRANIFRDTLRYPSSSLIPDEEQFEFDNYDPGARMMALYKPETSDIDRFRASINDMPRREDYTPNMTRGILGGIMALGGYERGQQYLNRPFDMAMDQWKTKMDPLQTAATLQHQGNVNARNAAQNIVSQEQADRRFQQQIRHQANQDEAARKRIDVAEGNLAEAQKRTRIAEGRAEIAREVAKGGVLEIDDAGTPRMRYRDGSYRIVDGEYLSAEEKQDLIKKRQLAVNQGSRPRLKESYMKDPNNPDQYIKSVINLDTGEETPVTQAPAKKPNKPTSVKDRPQAEEDKELSARAKRIKLARADWAPYIKFDKQGRFTEITRPGWLTGPKKEVYDQIYQAIYGKPAPADSGISSGQPATGKVKVRRLSDGVTGDMDANDPALKANPPKYEIISNAR